MFLAEEVINGGPAAGRWTAYSRGGRRCAESAGTAFLALASGDEELRLHEPSIGQQGERCLANTGRSGV